MAFRDPPASLRRPPAGLDIPASSALIGPAPAASSLFGRTLALLLGLLLLSLLAWSAALVWGLPVDGLLRPTPARAALLAGVAAGIIGAAAWAARRVNQPLRDLQFATSRVQGGHLDSRLSENPSTSEVREVNRGFNRMARELAKVEQNRAVMLAGISHDLRTPLSRLRLEAEMSVADEQARAHMVSDIAQLDAIIDKFMDYARPTRLRLRPLLLSQLIDKVAADLRQSGDLRIVSRVPINQRVEADEVELGRVFTNLFENARRYGRNLTTRVATVTITSQRVGSSIVCTLRDDGPGVPSEVLPNLTTPFYRGDAARTEASGAGLGLAICEKSMARMLGELSLSNAVDGSGLVVRLSMQPTD